MISAFQSNGYVKTLCKGKTSNPSAALVKSEHYEPGTHLILAVLGTLVYELNKCASTPIPSNIASCSNQLEVCRGYVKNKGDFSTSLESFPTIYITQEQMKLRKIATDKRTSAADYDQIDKTTKSADTMEKFVALIVTLVTMEKEKGEQARRRQHFIGLRWANSTGTR